MIFIASDHGGFAQKGKLVAWMQKKGYVVQDLGPATLDPDDDYPQFALRVAHAVQNGREDDRGVLLCRSGGGMTIAANKFKGIRAVNALNGDVAKHGRNDNDANVLVLSSDFSSENEAKDILDVFLHTAFSREGRHRRRVNQIAALEKETMQ